MTKKKVSKKVKKPKETQAEKVMNEFLDWVGEQNPEALYPSDLKDAIVGVVERCGTEPLIVLDKQECIRIFVERDGMTEEDAWDHFSYNVIGGYVGEGTPFFLTKIEDVMM